MPRGERRHLATAPHPNRSNDSADPARSPPHLRIVGAFFLDRCSAIAFGEFLLHWTSIADFFAPLCTHSSHVGRRRFVNCIICVCACLKTSAGIYEGSACYEVL